MYNLKGYLYWSNWLLSYWSGWFLFEYILSCSLESVQEIHIVTYRYMDVFCVHPIQIWTNPLSVKHEVCIVDPEFVWAMHMAEAKQI